MNGNIRTCYEYYNGNEEMQSKYDNTADAGTENNPYAIEDALDWCAIPSKYTNPSGTHPGPFYEIVNDIDMNDCDKQTIESAVIAYDNFNFTKIEGNGHSIRNLSAVLQNVYNKNVSMMVSRVYSGADVSIINNLNFINIIRYDSFTSLFSFTNGTSTCKFNNCNFTIYDYNRNGSNTAITQRSLFKNTCIFNYCTFNVKTALMYLGGYWGNNYYDSHNILSDSLSNTFNYCHINIEYMHGINPIAMINPGTYNFSYITLTVNYLGQDDKSGNYTYNLFKSLANSDDNSNWPYYLRGSYIYIKFKSNSTISRTDDNNTVGGPFLKLSIPGKAATSTDFSYSDDYAKSRDLAISRTTVPSFITIEDENKDDANKYIDISELTHFKPADIPDDGVYSINSTSSSLYYLTPENAKDYDILSKIDFPCLKV